MKVFEAASEARAGRLREHSTGSAEVLNSSPLAAPTPPAPQHPCNQLNQFTVQEPGERNWFLYVKQVCPSGEAQRGTSGGPFPGLGGRGTSPARGSGARGRCRGRAPEPPDLLSRPPDLRGRCPSGAGRVIGSCRSSRGTRVSRTRGRRRLPSARSAARFPRPHDLAWAGAVATGGDPRAGARAARGGSGAAGEGPEAYGGQRRAWRRRPRAEAGWSGLPPSGAAPGRTATVTARPPLPAVRFLLEPQASAGTLGGRGGARHATASGELGSGETGLHPPLAQAARPSGGASARPESSGLPPLPLFLSPRNLLIILPPRLEPCARRARNKHHI
ncbi:translation initiation factor IF-2-like [Prionailurus viverrinus]|uniref:translation initiation factor IF-2-like n=1 Tax=Prionailurus viverrinus TaxID=61388 RepID=UPI001FF187FE|nr:translation initiation factor IF-2-like [Prionailurus viverrinus]